MTVKILLFFFFCCCCQDQKVFSLSPLSAPRNNCGSFSSVSVSSVKCLGKVRRQEIFTQAALFFWGVWVVHHFMRQLSVLGLFLGLCLCYLVLKLRQVTTEKKKMLPQSVYFTFSFRAAVLWLEKQKYVVWIKNEFLHLCRNHRTPQIHKLIFSYLLIIILTGVSSQMQGRLGWLRHTLKNRHDKKKKKLTTKQIY